MHLEDIEAAIRGDNPHWPRTRLVCVENTHNRCYGAPLTPEYMDAVAQLAKHHGLFVHLDGARIFNAVVALERNIKEFTRSVDSLSFCLSKGLSGPIGSIVCGTRTFIAEARRVRKVLGGGMRQTGIIAAPGIVALERMIDRLKEDHSNARRLADGIARISGLSIDVERVKTNIVYFDLTTQKIDPDDVVVLLAKRGIKFLRTGARRYRMVTHYGISAEDIDTTVAVLGEFMQKLA
jgi:threonine aldolase